MADELTEVDLFTEDLVVIAHRDDPLAHYGGPLPFSVLADHDILLPMRGTPIRREIDEAARQVGVELHPRVELDGLRTIASMTFDGTRALDSSRNDAVATLARQLRRAADREHRKKEGRARQSALRLPGGARASNPCAPRRRRR